MELEERIAALEARLDAQEEKRKALRNQFIALQLVMIKLLPVISSSSSDQFDAGIDAAKVAATDGLSRAGFDAADTQDVLESMDALRGDLLGEGELPSALSWH